MPISTFRRENERLQILPPLLLQDRESFSSLRRVVSVLFPLYDLSLSFSEAVWQTLQRGAPGPFLPATGDVSGKIEPLLDRPHFSLDAMSASPPISPLPLAREMSPLPLDSFLLSPHYSSRWSGQSLDAERTIEAPYKKHELRPGPPSSPPLPGNLPKFESSPSEKSFS